MSQSSLWESAATLRGMEGRDIRHPLAVLVALIEMVAIGTSTYVAFIAYHLIVWKALADTISYGWMCTGLALIYGVICLADKQYDFLGAEWKQRGLEKGVLALTLAFVLLSISNRDRNLLLKGNFRRPSGIRIAGSDSGEDNALARRRDSPETRLLDPIRRDRFGFSRG
jgi:hypothetical protein